MLQSVLQTSSLGSHPGRYLNSRVLVHKDETSSSPVVFLSLDNLSSVPNEWIKKIVVNMY